MTTTDSNLTEEECSVIFCWCRVDDEDGLWPAIAPTSAMRWLPDYPALRFPASGEGSR